MWQVSSGAWDKYSANKGAYLTLLETFQSQESPSLRRIDKDLARTFPGHLFFDSEQGRAKLRRVLVAYSWYNSSVGYCQSLNFVAGVLLLFMEEEECFWMLQTIADNIACEYYTPGMVGLHVDLRLVDTLLQRMAPQLYSYLQQIDADISMITMKWLLTLGIGCFPTELALRILDIVFVEGIFGLLRVILALFIENSAVLMQLTDGSEMLKVMDAAAQSAFDVEHVITVRISLLSHIIVLYTNCLYLTLAALTIIICMHMYMFRMNSLKSHLVIESL